MEGMLVGDERQTNRLLGYPVDARLLIVNADDLGMCHAVNEAIFRAFEGGLLRSATLMVPCPWAMHAMRFLADRPDIPFGVHLTVVSEWAGYHWGPITPRDKVPSLVDRAGYFHDSEHAHEFLARINLDQLKTEFRAQVEAVLAAGLEPTHLDWHALRIGRRAGIFDVMLELAREYGLALRVAGRALIERVQSLGLPTSDHGFLDSCLLDPAGKGAHYERLLRALPEGVSEWAVHPGLDTPELHAIDPASALVRQTDLDFLMSQEAKDVVQEEGIVLLDYRAPQAIWRSA